MSMNLAVLLVIFTYFFLCLSSNSTKLCIGKERRDSNCSVFYTETEFGKLSKNISSNTAILITESYITLKEQLHFSHLENLKIQGLPLEGTKLHCNGMNASIQFTEIYGLIMRHITFHSCGGTFTSTTRVIPDGNFSLPLLAAIYMSNSTNIEIVSVIVHNSMGTGLVMFDCTGQINILNSTFANNSLSPTDCKSGGGGLYIEFSECSPEWVGRCDSSNNFYNSNSEFIIENCQFIDNNRSFSRTSDISQRLATAEYNRVGHGGGGVAIWARGHSMNNKLTVKNCSFDGNEAMYGGGLYFQFQQQSSNGNLLILSTIFKNNIASGGGGGIDIGSRFIGLYFPRNNTVFIDDCNFEENQARFGGGTAVFSTLTYKQDPLIAISFTNCTWKGNRAAFGLAMNVVALFTTQVTNHFTPSLVLGKCKFIFNKLIDRRSNTGLAAVHSKIFPMKLHSEVIFESNEGSGLSLVDSVIVALNGTTISFCNNTAPFGSGISLIGFSSIIVQKHVNLKFINNTAHFRGGAIYSYSIDEQPISLCFIEYSDENSYDPVFFNNRPNLYFNGNKALLDNGDSVFISSVVPCRTLCYPMDVPTTLLKLFQNCIANFEFASANITSQIATEGSEFHFPTENHTMWLKAMPGKDVILPFNVHDEFDNDASETLLLSVSSNWGSSLTLEYSYTANNRVKFKGQSNDTGTLDVYSKSFRTLNTKMKVLLTECPPGFLNRKNICICSAQINDDHYNSILICDSEKFTAYVSYGFWVGYVPMDGDEEGERNLYTAICPLGYCRSSSGSSDDNVHGIPLPTSASRVELDEVICGAQKRTGILCGDCVDKHSVYFHSWEYQCGHSQLCDYGIIFYFLSEIVPVTLTFGIVILTGINFNSGMLNGFVLFAQLSQSVSIMANGAIIYEDTERLFYDLSVLLYGPFNLNFFKIESLSFCIFKGANFFLIILMEFITLLYAFILVISLVYLMRSRCSYKLQIACYRKGITTTTSLTKGLSAFLILCYSQATRLCYQILNTSLLKGQGERPFSSVRVFRMGSVEYLTGIHIPFAIGAILILSTVVAIPPALLLAYPIVYKVLPKWVQKIKMVRLILNKLENYRPLFDTFQGCFRDKHRYFAGLFFVYRSIFVTTFAFINSHLVLFITNEIVIMTMLLIHLWIQPYKQALYNLADGLLYFFLAVINILTLWRFFLSYVQIRPQEVFEVGIAQLVILFIPGTVLVFLLFYKLFQKKIVFFHQMKVTGHGLTDSSEISLEDLHQYRAYSEPEDFALSEKQI